MLGLDFLVKTGVLFIKEAQWWLTDDGWATSVSVPDDFLPLPGKNSTRKQGIKGPS